MDVSSQRQFLINSRISDADSAEFKKIRLWETGGIVERFVKVSNP